MTDQEQLGAEQVTFCRELVLCIDSVAQNSVKFLLEAQYRVHRPSVSFDIVLNGQQLQCTLRAAQAGPPDAVITLKVTAAMADGTRWLTGAVAQACIDGLRPAVIGKFLRSISLGADDRGIVLVLSRQYLNVEL